MAIRMTGMISGLDTESLIKGMVDAQRMKYKKVEDNKTLLEWKQDKWKELNTKLYKLYTDDLSKMRLQTNYQTKKVTSSNEDLVSVTGKPNAPEGAHSLVIEQLAASQYLTGDELKGVTSDKKLTELGIANETLIKITSGGETKLFEVTNDTTISDFVSFAKNAGLNASYDEKLGRLFISSKKSGTENAFEITANSAEEAIAERHKILENVGYSYLSSGDKRVIDDALSVLATHTKADDEEAEKALQTLTKYSEKEVKRQITASLDAEFRATVETSTREAEIEAIKKEVAVEQLELLKEKYRQEKTLTEDEISKLTEADLDPAKLEEEQQKKIGESEKRISKAIDTAAAKAIADDKAKGEESKYTKALASDETKALIISRKEAVLADATTYQQKIQNQSVIDGGLDGIGLGSTAKPIKAEDSIVTYNGVEYKGSSNVFNINGLTITLKGESAGQTINLTVADDKQATYDMVKNFIKNYNEILKEMNTLYYAETARGYDPLSDDEREAMTDDQIEKWEKKIKDSILRRDSTLGSVLDAMKTTMVSAVEVDGKSYSLMNFGIQTSSDYTEKGLLHIYGDKDDSLYSSNENKLMKALEEDPDTLVGVLSKISQKLYDTMYDKMKSIPNVRSMYTFYNDKTMADQVTEYSKEIALNERKLTEMENKYYKQFAAMETAMAKLQSQSNALAGMLGMPTK